MKIICSFTYRSLLRALVNEKVSNLFETFEKSKSQGAKL